MGKNACQHTYVETYIIDEEIILVFALNHKNLGKQAASMKLNVK